MLHYLNYRSTYDNLLASKMVALVERGAPRDFRDIYAVSQAKLTTIHQCWRLWQNRLQAADGEVDSARARLAIETHLERTAQNRPLDQISNREQRIQAQGVRTWYREQCLHAKLD